MVLVHIHYLADTRLSSSSRLESLGTRLNTIKKKNLSQTRLATDSLNVGADPGNLKGGGALLPVQSHPLLGHTQFFRTVRLLIGLHFKFQVMLYNSTS